MPRRITLRMPHAADAQEFLAAARASRRLHRPWIYPPQDVDQFLTYLERAHHAPNRGLLVCERVSGRIAGAVTVSNMVHGLFQSAFLGYYAFRGFEGRGLMREGLEATVRLAFGKLKLHRLEANIQPGNAPSIALVKACGFQLEGYSPRYLKVGGRWRDHERWAIRAD